MTVMIDAINPLFLDIQNQIGKLVKDINKCRRKVSYSNYINDFLLNYDEIDGYYAKPSEAFSKLLKKRGFTYLNNGASRLALLYKENYVIKMDKSYFNASNKEELTCYNELLKNYPVMKYCLLPILHSFKIKRCYFLVFPLIHTFRECKLNGFNVYKCSKGNKPAILGTVYNKKKFKFLKNVFLDGHDDNYGYYKGQIFLIDYDNERDCSAGYHSAGEFFNLKKDLRKNLNIIKEMKALAG